MHSLAWLWFYLLVTNQSHSLTIIAIIRVVVFWTNRWGANETLGLYPLMHWSVIESQISVMCACLPAFRALVGRWFPRFLGGSTNRTNPSNMAEYYNKMPTANSNINKSVTYSVNYETRSPADSDVELVDMPKHGQWWMNLLLVLYLHIHFRWDLINT